MFGSFLKILFLKRRKVKAVKFMLILKIQDIETIRLLRLLFKWSVGVSTVLNPFSTMYIYIFLFAIFSIEQYVLEARYFGGSCNIARLLFRSL